MGILGGHRKVGSREGSYGSDLRKLSRLDLIELLVADHDAIEGLREELSETQERLAEELATVERLKAKLDDKDEQIEHLKERLDLKDARIRELSGTGDPKMGTMHGDTRRAGGAKRAAGMRRPGEGRLTSAGQDPEGR